MKPKTKRAFKANKLRSEILPCNIECPKPRRSIPVKEVNEMIEREVSRVKSERTIYDDRNSLIEAINEAERDIEHHEDCLHRIEKNLTSLKLQLNKTNTAIARELDLDSLR